MYDISTLGSVTECSLRRYEANHVGRRWDDLSPGERRAWNEDTIARELFWNDPAVLQAAWDQQGDVAKQLACLKLEDREAAKDVLERLERADVIARIASSPPRQLSDDIVVALSRGDVEGARIITDALRERMGWNIDLDEVYP